MLEADIFQLSVATTIKHESMTTERPVSAEKLKLIGYDSFLTSYWPHFSQNLKKGLGEIQPPKNHFKRI